MIYFTLKSIWDLLLSSVCYIYLYTVTRHLKHTTTVHPFNPPIIASSFLPFLAYYTIVLAYIHSGYKILLPVLNPIQHSGYKMLLPVQY
jgi:hypothetical protein